MELAQIGPLTTLTEALATAVGANAVLCSVVTGIWGLARGLDRLNLEESVLAAAYVGGGFGALFAVVDAVIRYSLLKMSCLRKEQG